MNAGTGAAVGRADVQQASVMDEREEKVELLDSIISLLDIRHEVTHRATSMPVSEKP